MLLRVMAAMRHLQAHSPKVKFKCQHGGDECMGNAWESCLLEVAPRHEDFFPVLDCVESRGCAEGVKPPDCVGKQTKRGGGGGNGGGGGGTCNVMIVA